MRDFLLIQGGIDANSHSYLRKFQPALPAGRRRSSKKDA